MNTMTQRLQGQWTINSGTGDDKPSKIVASWKLVLDPQQAAKRDKAVMDYLRRMSEHYGSPFSVDPAGLCSMWESAWMAGFENSAEQRREYEKAAAEQKAAKAAKRKAK